ncbi:class I SAM-dependent methyltransferase [Nocardia huaxiensis]|uniref:S-adenosyl-L-methionine-dependent methyltransferase n=1 Tax=Nocardia huaxiensis TaxID=2755382 RepID=A0A7D6ZUF1_9NOCA|nr:class I SAM-dependent methyltransferase [Nocardia huaxiensis]QLY28949.1 SAM-dependent methyltransferase [Nocardia huaxiensis]UFS97573.1 class I SAM-dependent methyltransferase [Nocardia huaxiensis]
MAERAASRTAVLVCQARAVGDGRLGVGRFSDPLAIELLREPEIPPVTLARSGVAPSSFGDRVEFELLTTTTDILVTRTVAIDDAVREKGNPQLVILGAGLDARAWRMPELAGVRVFEVDHPASQAEKRERLGERAPIAEVRFVPVDFAHDELGTTLAEHGHDETVPTTWIWEGVVPYLSPDEVTATVIEVAKRSAPGSRLLVSYPTPSPLSATVGRRMLGVLFRLAGRRSPLAGEPWRSAWTPEQMRDLLVEHGFYVVSDVDQLTIGEELGLGIRRKSAVGRGQVAVADRG